MCWATSTNPKIPTVEFIMNLPVLIPADLKSPCKMLLGIVTRLDRLSSELLTPLFTGDGNFLYTLETGLKITPSNAWLNANVALLTPSKQSLIVEGSFFFNNNSPSDPALTFNVNVRVVIIIITIFLIIVVLILYKNLK